MPEIKRNTLTDEQISVVLLANNNPNLSMHAADPDNTDPATDADSTDPKGDADGTDAGDADSSDA
jgi:hypothetical protein